MNQFQIIPLACALRTRNLPKFSVLNDSGIEHSRWC